MVTLTQVEEIVALLPADYECQALRIIPDELRGPEHPENAIVLKFEGGYITNSWDTLIKKTARYFLWISKLSRDADGVIRVSASDMAVLLWIKQAMVATRKAHSEGKLAKLTLWEKDGM